MTDESRSLSRRERREQELRAAARPADDTDAFPGAPISDSIPTHAPDGRALTRRERRRLERARLPMETWTAEEEMIATGQIPAMTPERIAEQERIAREKAEAAQREAQTASSEFGVVSADPAVAPSHGGDDLAEVSPASSSVSAESAPEPSVPQRTSLIPPSTDSAAAAGSAATTGTAASAATAESAAEAPETEPATQRAPVTPEAAAPAAPQPDLSAQADDAEHVQDVHEIVDDPQVDAAAGGAADRGPSRGGDPAADVQPEDDHAAVFGEQPQASHQWWEGSPFPDDSEQPDSIVHLDAPTAASAADTASLPPFEPATQPGDAEGDAGSARGDAPTSAPAVPGMPAGMSPEMFAALFPPGSLQRRLMEQQAAEQSRTEAPEPQVEDPAAEIRRLTQQAVAGIDAASSRRPVAPTEVDDPAAESAARAVLPNAWGPAAEAVSAPISDSGGWSSSPPLAAFPDEATGPQPWSAAAPSASVPSASAPSASDTWGQTPVNEQGPRTAPSADTTGRDDGGWDNTPVSLDETPFDAILGDHPATQALDAASNTTAEIHRPAFHTVATPSPQSPVERLPDASDHLAPHYAAFNVPTHPGSESAQAPSLWDAHPLMEVNRAAPELPEVRPAQNIPQPDLSSVRRPSFTPQVGDLSSIEPVPTGQIEVPRRERLDLEAAGGPRHFKWAHLAVFGAVAFLLGVVVWNVAMKP